MSLAFTTDQGNVFQSLRASGKKKIQNAVKTVIHRESRIPGRDLQETDLKGRAKVRGTSLDVERTSSGEIR